MPATIFARETHPSVRQSEWENDFSKNASDHSRSRNSLERRAEWVGKWLFSKCQRPIPLGKPIRAWGCVCGEMTFFQNASDNFRLGTSLAREAEWIVKWLFPNCQLSFFSFSELTRTRWWQVKQYPSAYATSNFERKPSNSRVEKWLFKKCHAPQLLGKFS